MNVLFCFFVLFLSVISNAVEQVTPADYCNNDLIKYCGEKKKTINGATVACLNKNLNNLTPSCKKNLPALAKTQSACFLDTINRCTNGVPPAAAMQEAACLEKNKAVITDDCKKLLKQHQLSKNVIGSKLQQFATACEAEANTCGGWKTIAQRDCIVKLYKQNKVSSMCKQGIETFTKGYKPK